MYTSVMGKKFLAWQVGLSTVVLGSAVGFGLRHRLLSEAHGASFGAAAPPPRTTGITQGFRPTWVYSPTEMAPSPAAEQPHDAQRRPMVWKAARQTGVSFESAGGALVADELHMRVHGREESSAMQGASAFGLRSLGLARGSSTHAFPKVEATFVNRHEVRLDRGNGVTESLRSIPRGYEQSWTFDHAPEGQGDLQVAVGVDPSFRLVRSAEDGIVLENASGAHVIYGSASWIDANGVHHDLRPTLDGSRVVLNVPHDVVERSAYPAVLDPVVIDAASFTESYAPSIAGDESTGRYLSCWEDYGAIAATFAAPKIACRLYIPSTNATVATFRVSTGTSAQFEPVVERLSSGKFVVMWRDLRSGKSQIYYSTVNASSGALYTQDNRVTSAGLPSTLDQYSPAISCGVGNSAASGSCLAVWGQINANSASEIYQIRYDFNTGTGIVSNTYFQGTVEQAANTPQTVDNYAPSVQLLDPSSGAAFNAHVVWEKMVGSNIRIRSAFVGRFPSGCQCIKDSVAVSSQPAGFITSETGDQFSPSLSWITDTGSAPRNHGILTYISTQTGSREVFMRSIEAFMGGGCTSVALPNSMSVGTQISSGGGAKDFVSKLACIGTGTANTCRVAYAIKNGASTSNVSTLINTTAASPYFSVGATTTHTTSATASMLNARLGSLFASAGPNSGWLLLWDDSRGASYQTYAARLSTAGASLDGTTGFKWSF